MKPLPAVIAVLLVTGPVCSGTAMAQIDLSVCQYLPRHRPAPDVEYTPGVDVSGRPVAPADLPGGAGTVAPLERFDIPVTLNFARRMGFAVPRVDLPGNTEIGHLTLSGNRLLFNGQPIGNTSTADLYALCRTVR